MRVLRLYSNSSRQDMTVSYFSSGNSGSSLVNGNMESVYCTKAGYRSDEDSGYQIVISSGYVEPERGYFLSVNKGETLFMIENIDKGRMMLSVAAKGFVSVSDRCSFLRPLRTGILTVSDKGSRGEREDTSGPALEVLVNRLGAVISEKAILPDEKGMIEQILLSWSEDSDLDLILVTGGTGLSKRDVTPEALDAIAEKQIPGLGEYMRMRTSEYTERAILSRGKGIVRSGTLIVALPGSTRGATQCLDAIAPVLRHGVEIIRGWAMECGHSN